MTGEGKLIRIFPTLNRHNLTVEDMDLEVAVRNALKRSGIHTLAQLLQLSHPELVQIFANRELRSYEDVIHCLVCLSEGMDATASEFASVTDISNTLGRSEMSDRKFNIFQVGGYWEAEEFHTKVIAELINPQSKFHDKGVDFLDKFLQKIGAGELPCEELTQAEVKTEVPTNKDRRIDMVISTKSRYLPFEVKIWAGDQDTQLWDYYTFAKEQAKEKVDKIYYLTPDKHEPSEQSRRELGTEVCLLSFEKHILPWLKECMDIQNVPPDVKEIMKQLRDNIQGQPGSQGFSEWTWGVLDIICLELSRKYNLRWTECRNRYRNSYKMFTLHSKGPLEFALRIEEEDNRDQVRLYLICGIMRDNGKPDYGSTVTDDYLSKNDGKYDELLEETFKDGGKLLELKTGPIRSAWNRLPEGNCYKQLDAEQCLCEIEKIFKGLNLRVYQALKRK